MVSKADTPAPAAAEAVPYVGPRPFESDDSRFFFGRDDEAAELLAQIISYRIVVFYAPSGAGKTSLLNAQVIPQLEAKGFEVLPSTRVQGASLAELSPGGNPYVLSALSGWAVEAYSPAELAELTISGYLAGHEPLEDSYGQPAPRVLVFDQFEELFTAYPTRWQDRESFFGQLGEALEDDPWLRIVLSMREDHIAQLEPYAADMPDFLRHRFRLERMRPEAALQAVSGPARASGRSFAPGAAEKLVEELGQTRVESAGGPIIGRGQFVEPVQLQVVCRKLWLSLPPEVTTISESEIEEYGDVNQALSDYYEDVVSRTVSAARVSQGALRDWFEKKLITPAKTRGLVFYDQEKGQTAGLDNNAIRELDSQHMIRGEIRAGSRWYELTHDRFIDPILAANEAWRQKRWKRLLRVGQGSIGMLFFLLIVGVWIAGTITETVEGPEQTQNAVLAATATADRGTQVALGNDLTRSMETAEAATATEFSDRATAGVEAAAATLDMQTAVAATATRIEENAQATASVIAVTEIARATVDAQATITAQELQRLPIRPLRPGISVGSTTGYPGSLTGFALSGDGRLNLVLPATILGNADTPIIQPSPLDGGQLANEVGRTVFNEVDQRDGVYDAASLWGLAVLKPDVAAQITIPGLGSIRGVREPQPGSEIRIISRSGDATIGRLGAVSPGESFGLFGDVYGAYEGVIPLFGISLPVGDEGGLVIDDERFAVGVIVGAAAAPNEPPSEDVQLMAPLVDVMAYLDATFLHQGAELATLTEPGREAKAIAFSPDGRWLAGASFDTNVYLWDTTAGLPLAAPLVLGEHPRGVWDLEFSSDGAFLATAGIAVDVPSGTQLYLWDLTAANPAANPVRLGGGFGDLVDVAISPDDRWLAATGANDDIYLWDLSAGANRRVLLNGHGADTFINELFFSPDGGWLASAGTDQTVRLWDLEAAANSDALGPSHTLDRFDRAVTFVTGSRDGRYLVASSAEVVTVWDVSDWPAAPVFVASLEGHAGRVTLATFSPDGRLLATGGEDSAIRLWSAGNFEPIAALSGFSAVVRALAFSPDSAWLASGGSDGTIRLWSMTTDRPGDDVLTLTGHADAVRQLAFRPDGLWLASGSDDTTLRMWQAR